MEAKGESFNDSIKMRSRQRSRLPISGGVRITGLAVLKRPWMRSQIACMYAAVGRISEARLPGTAKSRWCAAVYGISGRIIVPLCAATFRPNSSLT